MNNNTANFGQDYVIASLEVPEYNQYHRSKRWYIIALLIMVTLLIYAFLASNFLFAVIVIISALVLVLREGQDPGVINVEINREGVIMGKTFYDYDEFKDFSIIYKPMLGDKNLYFEFKNTLKPRLSFPLGEINPVDIRKELLKYLKEDLERDTIPLSESLSKIIKL